MSHISLKKKIYLRENLRIGNCTLLQYGFRWGIVSCRFVRKEMISKEMCQFFETHGYPASDVQAAHHRAQQIDRQSALQTSQKEKNDRILFTLTFHPHNNPVKGIILNNFKILQNDPETGAIFSQQPLISFKRDKNVGNFLVRSTFKTIEKPDTFTENTYAMLRKMIKTHPNQSHDILISLTILKNTCLFAAFPTSGYHRQPQKSGAKIHFSNRHP